MDLDEEVGIFVYRVMNSEGEMIEKSEDFKVIMIYKVVKKILVMSFIKDEL